VRFASTKATGDLLTAYTSWGASRSRVDKAGRLLRNYWLSPTLLDRDVDDAFEIAWRFRAEFQIPLTKVVMGVRSFVNTEGAPVVVAQRLKRMPTIVDKLTRHPAMQLSRMQDIGGCRSILPAGSYDLIRRVRDRMARRDWDIVEEYDYVSSPKRTGYRGLHVVVLRDDRLIEVQLRTDQQHRWAETVERLGSRTGFNLKDGQGPEELLLYLERAAYGVDLTERGIPLPPGFREEFLELTRGVQPYLVGR
jgi:hypothetical protein